MENTIVSEIYQLTDKLYSELKKRHTIDNRDKYIKKIDRYIELRQKLINQLPTKITEVDKQLLTHTIELQKKIDDIMISLQADIQSDIKKLNKQKLINKNYDNAYSQYDGNFIDKKR